MRTAGYCPHCGDQVKRSSSRYFFASLCSDCARLDRRSRYLRLASVALCAWIVFAAGRLTAPHKSPQFLGTAVDLNSVANLPPARDVAAGQAIGPGAIPASDRATDHVCGAPTRSGRPCQRKVKGGGYCWQHRDKPGPKKDAPPAR